MWSHVFVSSFHVLRSLQQVPHFTPFLYFHFRLILHSMFSLTQIYASLTGFGIEIYVPTCIWRSSANHVFAECYCEGTEFSEQHKRDSRLLIKLNKNNKRPQCAGRSSHHLSDSVYRHAPASKTNAPFTCGAAVTLKHSS